MTCQPWKPTLFLFLIVLNTFSVDCFGQECWLNSPFAPFVRLELSVKHDELILMLRNDFEKPVRVTGITLSVEGIKPPIVLLKEALDLPPADRHYWKLKSTLEACFDEKVGKQQKVIRFQLSLEPEPPGQPKECAYQVTAENQLFTECTRVSSKVQG